MASSGGQISAAKGGSGSVATPANSVGGDSTAANRRVCIPFPVLHLLSCKYLGAGD